MILSYKDKMEFANAISHGICTVFYLVAVPVLIATASFHGGSFALIMGVSIYGFSLLMMYLASTLYHSIPIPKYKVILRVLDHIAIFVLIAGSYTPFLIRYLGLLPSLPYLLIVWGITFAGAIFKIFFTGKYKAISISLYIAQGFMVLLFYPVLAQMSDIVFKLVLTGGVFFLVGVVFYAWEKIPYHHTFWHIFVFLGTLAHFMAVVYAVMYM